MSIFISIDGNITEAKDAKISILDRGFLYGDSVYEVMRTCDGKAFAMPEHLQRLRKSAQKIFLEIPWSNEDFSREVEALLAHAKHTEESYIRIIVTRGESTEIGLDPALSLHPCHIILVKPFPAIPAELYTKGAKVALVHHSPNPFCGIKTGNYLPNIIALREARSKNAYEAWLVDETGRLTEGANSNLFLVKGGKVVTPPVSAGLLEGITRQKILELCKREQIPAREKDITITDAFAADEAFLTSSLREVMPVTEIDNRKVSDGNPGPITKKIREKFRQMAGGKEPGQ
jgi:branched-chain amino acid aminotransferase